MQKFFGEIDWVRAWILTHLIPITFSFVLASYYFWPRFRALGWWNVQCICFRFGRPRTAVPERANRSDENHCFPPSLSVIAGPSRYCWSESGLGFRVTISSFWPSSRLNSQSGFSWLLVLHFSVQTRIARTPTFLSLYTDYFGYSCCVSMHRSFWLFLCEVRIVARLRQFSVCVTLKISLSSVFWLGQFWLRFDSVSLSD
jgi:hypothetical protein